MKHLEIHPNYQMDWITDTQYCHHGIPLSNGIFGALLWFQENTLMITVNRADYWDHRGGMIWNEDCNFTNVRELLEQGAYAEAQNLFRIMLINGKEKKPTRLPMGRFEVTLKEGMQIVSARLDLLRAEALIDCVYKKQKITFKASILMDQPILALTISQGSVQSIQARPAYEFPQVKEYFDAFHIAPPVSVSSEGFAGWIQELPEDPATAVLAQSEQLLLITGMYGDTEQSALTEAKKLLTSNKMMNYNQMTALTKREWEKLWKQTADISLADRELETLYYLGIYKMLGNSMPGGIAPTLQGPWVEEHRMAPWSGDYHFNINVQECLWPAYASNHLEALLPLFQMIERWKPLLAERARIFTGEEDGYQMVHACDDRGQVIGKFWTGIIDHANTSWVAQMMWQYGQYAGDEQFLLHEVYPFMKKALNVFLRMMEYDGQSYSLPVTVSPEYGGAGDQAWGRNSSFFLYNIHFLCDKMLRMEEKFRWDDEFAGKLRSIKTRLPEYTTGPGARGEEIYLWEGQALAESHRHHSHLAGIYPFDTINPENERHKEVIRNTYHTWVARGMGNWTGWSMPWASILHARLGGKDMAYLSLKLLSEIFMMPGYATGHNAVAAGFTTFTGGDVMQVEASIAAAAAVLEMYVQCVQGEIRLFPALPDRFGDASFAGIRTEGAFLISAARRNGLTFEAHIYSEKGGTLRLRNPVKGTALVHRSGFTMETSAKAIVLEMKPGETVTIRPACE